MYFFCIYCLLRNEHKGIWLNQYVDLRHTLKLWYVLNRCFSTRRILFLCYCCMVRVKCADSGSTGVRFYTWTLQWQWSFTSSSVIRLRLQSVPSMDLYCQGHYAWLICCSCPLRVHRFNSTYNRKSSVSHSCHESFNLWLHYFVESALHWKRGQTRQFA